MNRLEKIQVEEEKIRYADKFATTIMESFIYSMIETLYDDYGFGAKRLGKLFKGIYDKTSMLSSGMIGIDLYKESVKEKCNFKIPDYYNKEHDEE